MENLYLQNNGNEWRNPMIESQSFEREIGEGDERIGFGEMPHPNKVQAEMEMDPKHIILVAANKLLYFGGPLEVKDYVEIKVQLPAFGAAPGEKATAQRPIMVKRISEDGRTLAFATDAEKAKRYIKSKQDKSEQDRAVA